MVKPLRHGCNLRHELNSALQWFPYQTPTWKAKHIRNYTKVLLRNLVKISKSLLGFLRIQLQTHIVPAVQSPQAGAESLDTSLTRMPQIWGCLRLDWEISPLRTHNTPRIPFSNHCPIPLTLCYSLLPYCTDTASVKTFTYTREWMNVTKHLVSTDYRLFSISGAGIYLQNNNSGLSDFTSWRLTISSALALHCIQCTTSRSQYSNQ